MTARQRTTIIASGCLAVSMTACVLLLRHIDRLRPQATIDDVVYLASPKMVKRASIGFDGLMACIYWTRTVQYFGHRHYNHEQTYNELAPLLEITTTLDPQLFPPYQFGASFLAPAPPNGAGETARAIQLMEFGIAHNPDNWKLYYNLGFVYYTELNDYKKAGEIFERGSEIHGAHPFMKILAAQMAEHAGDFATARLLWSATFETSHETNIRQNAMEHLRSISVDEDVTNLQAAVTRFGEKTGHLPSDMAELAAAEHLPGIPADPDGDAYQLTPEGRIQIAKPDDFPFVTKGLPPGYKPVGRPKFHTSSSLLLVASPNTEPQSVHPPAARFASRGGRNASAPTQLPDTISSVTDSSMPRQPSVRRTAWEWWKYAAAYEGWVRATRRLLGVLWEFARDSTPERRRLRFGDADYDWDHRVNTTSGAVAWRDRLLGMFHSAYQPTEPAAFHEMMNALRNQTGLDFREFTFVDLGSGKGRTLLMASNYPFRRIVGVELLPALHEIAQENLKQYKNEAQKCFALESVCADANEFIFPGEPLVVYLFNPLPESGMRRVTANLGQSLRAHPRAVYVLYHNPLLEHVLMENAVLRKIGGAEHFSVFSGSV